MSPLPEKIMEGYRGVDARTSAFAIATGPACPPGRGRCCLSPHQPGRPGSGGKNGPGPRLRHRFHVMNAAFRILQSGVAALVCATPCTALPASELRALPNDTVFKGEAVFHRLLAQADSGRWNSLPIGTRTAAFGFALCGTPYRSHTLEIDDHTEAPSVDFTGLDCWTFFEASLAMARLLDLPPAERTPRRLLDFIELDRYRGGRCTGHYLSRLHYLEDWLWDNDRRGLVADLTPKLGGVTSANVCREMTLNWRYYRYLRADRALLPDLRQMEERVEDRSFFHIPKNKVARVEPLLRDGDVISIVSRNGKNTYSTSHVGLARRDASGVLRFMHASSQGGKRKVLVDDQLSRYLYSVRGDAGILVARPLK